MSKKRKNVRFAEGKDDDGVDDQELLRLSAKRRLGDETMGGISRSCDAQQRKGGRTTYDDIGPATGVGFDDQEFPKTHAPGQHTLDSDEEDETLRQKDSQRLDVDNVEGQEDNTIEFDHETKITPFNMKEELEEGFYDTEGNFVFDKTKAEIKDAWLDDIDWTAVKKDAGDLWSEETDGTGVVKNDEMEGIDQSEPSFKNSDEKIEIYRRIIDFMRPSETITKTLKRLGNGKSATETRRERWRVKKLAQSQKTIDEDVTTAEFKKPVSMPSGVGEKIQEKNEQSDSLGDGVEPHREPSTLTLTSAMVDQVTEMTSLVDRLVGDGEFEIYGWTFEKIKFEIDRNYKAKKFAENLNTAAELKSGDDELDMFAEVLDKNQLTTKQATSSNSSDTVVQEGNEQPPVNSTSNSQSVNEVCWEFKWRNEPEVEVFGPFDSACMQKWADEQYFKEGVWVRRVDQPNSKFYSSKRIDFDLYI